MDLSRGKGKVPHFRRKGPTHSHEIFKGTSLGFQVHRHTFCRFLPLYDATCRIPADMYDVIGMSVAACPATRHRMADQTTQVVASIYQMSASG